MKNLFPLLIVLSTGAAFAGDSCCQTKGGPAGMAELGSDPVFIAVHQAPNPMGEKPTGGHWVDYPVADGLNARGYLALPANQKPTSAVIVIHEWWGLNDYMKRETERISRELGVAALAVDLFNGQTATKPEQAGKLTQGVNQEGAMANLMGATRWLRSEEGPGAKKVAVIGWCFGGAWSLQLAASAGNLIDAAVVYYGMPIRNREGLRNLTAPVLGIFAEKDARINRPVVGEFETAAKAEGKQVTLHWYDADHAFANPSNPKFDAKNAADAWSKTKAFLQRHLK